MPRSSLGPCCIKTTKWWYIIFGFSKCGLPVSNLFLRSVFNFNLKLVDVTSSWRWSTKLKLKMATKNIFETGNESAQGYYNRSFQTGESCFYASAFNIRAKCRSHRPPSLPWHKCVKTREHLLGLCIVVGVCYHIRRGVHEFFFSSSAMPKRDYAENLNSRTSNITDSRRAGGRRPQGEPAAIFWAYPPS